MKLLKRLVERNPEEFATYGCLIVFFLLILGLVLVWGAR